MTLGPVTENDVQMLLKKHECNRPDGGAVIHMQNAILESLHPHTVTLI